MVCSSYDSVSCILVCFNLGSVIGAVTGLCCVPCQGQGIFPGLVSLGKSWECEAPGLERHPWWGTGCGCVPSTCASWLYSCLWVGDRRLSTTMAEVFHGRILLAGAPWLLWSLGGRDKKGFLDWACCSRGSASWLWCYLCWWERGVSGFSTQRLPGLAGCCGMVPLAGAAHIPRCPWWERVVSGSPVWHSLAAYQAFACGSVPRWCCGDSPAPLGGGNEPSWPPSLARLETREHWACGALFCWGRAHGRHATVAAAQVSSQLALLSMLQCWPLSELSFGSCFVPVYYLQSDLWGSIREKSVFVWTRNYASMLFLWSWAGFILSWYHIHIVETLSGANRLIVKHCNCS